MPPWLPPWALPVALVFVALLQLLLLGLLAAQTEVAVWLVVVAVALAAVLAAAVWRLASRGLIAAVPAPPAGPTIGPTIAPLPAKHAGNAAAVASQAAPGETAENGAREAAGPAAPAQARWPAVVQLLLAHSPLALLLLQAGRDGAPPLCLAASPGARDQLGLADDAPPSWDRVLAQLPEALRSQAATLLPGRQIQAEGWLLRLDALAGPDLPAGLQLLALTAADGNADTAALAAEHAAFSYTISHDLRAPIRVVEGFGRILKEDYGNALDRMGRDHIDRIMSAAARMNQMIDALLSLSRLSTQPLQRQPVNLSQLAGFVVDELRRAQPERQVAVHIAPEMRVQGDPTLLRMALENLLGNAWKYSAKVAQAQIRFEPELQDGRPGFVVSDNGAGFDMRFADRLFGVFQRLHSSSDFQGTGVGLASVRRIVRRHGGEIWAESEVGQGARFHFRLG